MPRIWYVYEDLGNGKLKEWVFEAGIMRTLAKKVKEAGIPPEKIKFVLNNAMRTEAEVVHGHWLKLYLSSEV